MITIFINQIKNNTGKLLSADSIKLQQDVVAIQHNAVFTLAQKEVQRVQFS